MTLTDNVIKTVFINLESFLQKAAALDVFEALIFNYKTKTGQPDPVALNFLAVVTEFSNELNFLLKEHGSEDNAKEFSNPEIQNFNCSVSDNKSSESYQDIPLVLPFSSEDINEKTLELLEIPVVTHIESHVCDRVSDTEKLNEFICEEEYETSKTLDTHKENILSNQSKEESPIFIKNETEEQEITESSATLLNSKSETKSVCNDCGRKFSSSAKLIGHLNKCLKPKFKNDKEQVYKCSICEMTFLTTLLLKSHLAESHSKEVADQQATDDHLMYRVVEVQSLPENLPFYCCKSCLFVYKTIVDFEAHICKEVADTTESEGYMGDYFHLLGKYLISNPDLLARMKKFRCGTCCEEYRSLDRMLYHLVRCTQGPYSCEICGLQCTSKRELNGHKRKLHRDANSFFCDECGLAFKLRASLQKHKVNHHERQNSTTCEKCNLTFSKRIHFTNHMIREHQAERKFLCQVCGKTFSTHGSLTSHLTSHTEPFKFSCSFCNKKFRLKEKLKFHTRIHTGERPHLCPTCGKGFIRKSKLDDHMRRHRGEKQYLCTACVKTYASSWDLKLHIKKQHPEYWPPGRTVPVTIENITEPCNLETEADDPIEEINPTTTMNILSHEEANETLRRECTLLTDLPDDAALAQLVDIPLTTADAPVGDSLTQNEGKLVVQLEQSQMTNSVIQTAGDAISTPLLLQLGQNGDASSQIFVQLDGGQMAAQGGQPALLQPSTIFTVADSLQLTPVVDDLNLNLNSLSTQFMQLTAAPGSAEGNDSTGSASNGSATAMPVHIQLPVSTMPVPTSSLPPPATSIGTPYSLQSMPVQAVFTPTNFNVNSISY